MDANHFLRERLATISKFYTLGSEPFRALLQQIDEGLPPFEPRCSEDGGFAFELEYNQAKASLDLMGAVSLSLVAGALQLFLDTLVKLYGHAEQFRKTKTDEGWWGRHQAYFLSCGFDFKESGANVRLLQEIVLARNSVMHQEALTLLSAVYRDEDLQKVPNPFFISTFEAQLLKSFEDGDEHAFLFAPTIDVDGPKLEEAVAQTQQLTNWLEQSIVKMLCRSCESATFERS